MDARVRRLGELGSGQRLPEHRRADGGRHQLLRHERQQGPVRLRGPDADHGHHPRRAARHAARHARPDGSRCRPPGLRVRQRSDIQHHDTHRRRGGGGPARRRTGPPACPLPLRRGEPREDRTRRSLALLPAPELLRPVAHVARLRPGRAGGARSPCGGSGRARPRPPRWSRHATVLGARVHRGPRATSRGSPSGRPHRIGRRPLLRDGPGPPLGAHRAWLRRDRPCRGPATGGQGHRRRHRGLRPRRDRRVRRAHRGPRRRTDARRRRGGVHEFPRRPRAPVGGGVRRARLRRLRRSPPAAFAFHLPHRVRRDIAGAGGVRARRPAPHPRRTARRRRHGPAAHRRDREVRARDLLLQRRARGRVPGRGTDPGAQSEGRHLRPAAADELSRSHREAGRGDRFRPLRPDRVQPGEPGHGRAHRRPRCRRASAPDPDAGTGAILQRRRQ